MAKNTVCIWYEGEAETAARFYAETFPDSRVDAIRRAPGDYPDGKAGDVLVVEFTVAGIPCIGLNGEPQIKQSEAFSFQVTTENQAETDRYWNAIVGKGGDDADAEDRHRRDRGRRPRLGPGAVGSSSSKGEEYGQVR
jgi:predicted 3-demethylubiquinone-9 3-methyltransferase (glyoxalase superfamily)